MDYILWINEIVVRNNDEEYDFLEEMYPEIKELYNQVWYLQHLSTIIDENKRNKINKIKETIQKKLAIYQIPEYILFKKENDIYIEPNSNEKFNIVTKAIHLRKAEEENVNEYLNNLKDSDINFLKEKMPLFNEVINNKNLTLIK